MNSASGLGDACWVWTDGPQHSVYSTILPKTTVNPLIHKANKTVPSSKDMLTCLHKDTTMW
jgi:hypothetical protein